MRSVSSNTVNDVSFFKLRTISDARGTLVPLDPSIDDVFKINRLFYVYGLTAEVRGKHAHRKTNQFFICMNGECIVRCDDGHERKEFILNERNVGLYVPTMIWSEQEYSSKDTVLLVLCDDAYDESEYIRDYNEFLEEVK